MIATQLLDALRAKLESDSAVARAIGISRQAVSNIRRGVPMSETTALTCCTLLAIDPGPALAYLRADYAETETLREQWRDIATRLLQSAPTGGEPNIMPDDYVINIISKTCSIC